MAVATTAAMAVSLQPASAVTPSRDLTVSKHTYNPRTGEFVAVGSVPSRFMRGASVHVSFVQFGQQYVCQVQEVAFLVTHSAAPVSGVVSGRTFGGRYHWRGGGTYTALPFPTETGEPCATESGKGIVTSLDPGHVQLDVAVLDAPGRVVTDGAGRPLQRTFLDDELRPRAARSRGGNVGSGRTSVSFS